MTRTFRPLRPLHPVRQHRLAGAVAIVLALALVGSACSDNGVAGGYAAKVGGQTVDERDFLRELGQFSDNPAAEETFGITSDGGAVSTELSTAWLNFRLQDALVVEGLERRGLDVNEAELAEVEQIAVGQFGGERAWSGFAPWFRERVVTRLARVVKLQRVIGGDVTEERVRAEFEATKDELDERVCLAHILVPTEEQALEIKSQIEGGGDFAQLAQEHSTDPGSGAQGGELGCHAQGTFVGPFDEAAWSLPPEQLSDPIETQFGWHLVLVHTRGAPAFEDVRGEIEGRLQERSGQAFAEAINELLSGLDVEVNPKYGTFDPAATSGGFVLPPGVPQVSDGPPSDEAPAPPFDLQPTPGG